MSRVSLARQLLSDTGFLAAYSPAAETGHKVENDGKVFLHVRNYSEDDIIVTILSGYVRAGLKLADRIVEVCAGEEKFIGPFDPDIYNQTDGGKGHIYIDYSAVEGVTVAALLFP
jgi:hypothetical protein